MNKDSVSPSKLLVDPEWKKDDAGNFKLYLAGSRPNRIDDLTAFVYANGDWITWTFLQEPGWTKRGENGHEANTDLAKVKCVESLKKAGLEFAKRR